MFLRQLPIFSQKARRQLNSTDISDLMLKSSIDIGLANSFFCNRRLLYPGLVREACVSYLVFLCHPEFISGSLIVYHAELIGGGRTSAEYA